MGKRTTYAIVTGGGSGIGLHYADQLAGCYGYNLLLVSNRPAELEEAALRFRNDYAVDVLTLTLDLSDSAAAETLFRFAEENNLEVEVLVNNAGMLVFDLFNRVEMSRLETLLGLHIVTTCLLCRLFGEQMAKRGKGYILNMASMTAWTALPTIQTYNATKNFVLQFSRSLWYELMPQGVHVLAVCPGSTNTGLLPFPPKWARLLLRMGITMEPETLVRGALKRLLKTKQKVYLPGLWNYIAVPVLKHLPDRLVFYVLRKLMGVSPTTPC